MCGEKANTEKKGRIILKSDNKLNGRVIILEDKYPSDDWQV